MFDFSIFKKSIGSLANEIKKGRAEIEKLRQRRDLLLAAPPTKDDCIAILHQRVDGLTKDYPAQVQLSLLPYLNNEAPTLANRPLGFLYAVGGFNSNGGLGDANNLMSSLAFLLQDQFKQGITRAIEAMEWPEGAVPLAARAEELNSLDGKIAKLEEADRDLLKAAVDAGITINF